MDDLLGEDWKASSKPRTITPGLNATAFASSYSSLQSTSQPVSVGVSGASTPHSPSRPSSTVNGAKPSTNDQFGNLLSLKSQAQRPGAQLSIQQRQEQILAEKRKQKEQQAQLWDTLGSGRGTPETRAPSPGVARVPDDEDDILAAFNKDASVNSASHFPPPRESNTHTTHHSALAVSLDANSFDDDDDTFGLGSIPKSGNGTVAASAGLSYHPDDDILGDLGRPVEAIPKKDVKPVPQAHEQYIPSSESHEDPEDRAVAELVDMGFPADTAKIALAETSGDVQSAVGWLLQQAHEESKQKAEQARGETRMQTRSPQRKQPVEQDAMPAWMRQEIRSTSRLNRHDNASPASGEGEPGQVASQLGSKLFKSANSLWKASQKQMAKTVAEFQTDRDPAQPRWMQESSGESSRAGSQSRSEHRPGATRRTATRPPDVTNEAALLDMPREDRPPKNPRPSATESFAESPMRGRSPAEPISHRSTPQPRFAQQAPQQDKRPTNKLTQRDVEEQSAQAYISPARRKRPIPTPELRPQPQVDLFSPAPTASVSTPVSTAVTARTAQAPQVSRQPPAPSKPKAPSRQIPAVSPAALSASAGHRKTGGEAFKRGDYAAAHESYTAALTPLPASHPIMIIVLSNRSLTALKTGDAKTAVSDADRALELIGVGQGVSESIELGSSEATKDMRDFYGKALMRKAEALEHMEKWADATSVWRQAIAAGVGGAVSLRGRDRCEKAAAPKAAEPARAKPAAPARSVPARGLGNSMQRPTLSSPSSATAVKALRAANAAAEKVDDERFALTDQVDARLTTWKGGKADNLRALLQSLDGVLWSEAGWKKVGMSDLVMPNKVKIVYMKAIAKVHPDKVSQHFARPSAGSEASSQCWLFGLLTLCVCLSVADSPRRHH